MTAYIVLTGKMEKTTTKIFKKGSLDFKDPVRISNIQTEDSTAGIPNGHTELSANAKAIIVKDHEDFLNFVIANSYAKK